MAKVDELMALLDRLEAARTAAEATRDRLTAASLARLTATDSGPDAAASDLPHNARFALATLPALTTRPDQIKPLRQTILNLAVRGKLVEQDPNDEPASELLKRIAAGKTRLVREGEIRKKKPPPPIGDEETCFNLPDAWEWVRLGDLSQFVTSGSRDWAKFYAPEGAIFVRMAQRVEGRLPTRFKPTFSASRIRPLMERVSATQLEAGETYSFSLRRSMGLARTCSGRLGTSVHQSAYGDGRVRPDADDVDTRFCSIQRLAKIHMNAFKTRPQTGLKNSFRRNVTQLLVPLPPLPEQHRIVAKVDALMALCDRLEAALTTADTSRARLLEALLHEALEPAGTPA